MIFDSLLPNSGELYLTKGEYAFLENFYYYFALSYKHKISLNVIMFFWKSTFDVNLIEKNKIVKENVQPICKSFLVRQMLAFYNYGHELLREKKYRKALLLFLSAIAINNLCIALFANIKKIVSFYKKAGKSASALNMLNTAVEIYDLGYK